MKDLRNKDQIKSDDKRNFLENSRDYDFINMLIRLEKTPDNKLNSAENLMSSIIFRNTPFSNETETNLKKMKELLNEYIKEKPNFKIDLEKHLKSILSALEKKKERSYND